MIALGSTTDFYKICDGFDMIQKAFAGENLVWEFQVDWNKEYLEFDVVSGGTIGWLYHQDNNSVPDSRKNIQYSKNNGAWTTLQPTTGGTTFTVVAGDKVRFRAENSAYNFYYENIGSAWNMFMGTATFNIVGNIMSLIYKNSFIGANTLTTINTFNDLFASTNVISAENLKLPVTALTESCYEEMFYNCTMLTSAPNVSSTTLAKNCYRRMFYGCTSLATTPALNSTNLTEGCYYGMFYNCSSLTAMPALQATTLQQSCYAEMFHGCTGLTTPALIYATTLAENCYYNMFYGCTSLTATPALNVTTLQKSCYKGMFRGCTSLTVTPDLPATTLVESCYEEMFFDCSGLTKITSLPFSTVGKNSCYRMFYNCSSLGNEVPSILSPTTLAEGCYHEMFRGCSSLYKAPKLPAEILATDCYRAMFYGCSYLSEIECYAKNISATRCTQAWVQAVNSTGIFKKSIEMLNWTTGVDGIPSGWTVVNGDKFEDKYLTFQVTASGNILWKQYGAVSKTIQYSINNGEWTSLTSSTSSLTTSGIQVQAGDYVRIKGTNDTYASSNSIYCNFEGGIAVYNVYGNIMSMIYGDNFVGQTTLPSAYTFCSLFKLSNAVDASSLVLPADTLTEGCYRAMFSKASMLTKAPALPATTLANYCYWYMFEECPITIAPDLPYRDAVPANGYGNMFIKCSNLRYIKCLATNISAASATANWVSGVSATGTFVKNAEMTSWTTGVSGIPNGWTVVDYNIPIEEQYLTFEIVSGGTIGVTTVGNYPSKQMKYNVNGTGWRILTTSGSSGTVSIPSLAAGDKVRFKADNLAFSSSAYGQYIAFKNGTAKYNVYGNIMSMIYEDNFIGQDTILSDYQFSNMFNGCQQIVSIENLLLPATTLTSYCYANMFASSTVVDASVLELPAMTMQPRCYHSMFSGCSSLTKMPELPATTLAVECYYGMFLGCSSLAEVVSVLPATTLAEGCYGAMFQTSTAFTVAPTLPALTLVDQCYIGMFNGCSSLEYIKCLAIDLDLEDEYSTAGWIWDVNSTGIFVKNDNCDITDWQAKAEGAGIPAGWTVYDESVDPGPPAPTHDYSQDYLTFVSKSNNNTIGWKTRDAGMSGTLPLTISYSTDNGSTWTDVTSTTGGTTVATINDGDKLLLKGSNSTYSTSSNLFNYFTSTGQFDIEGNIMSMIYGDNFVEQTTLSANYTFNEIFYSLMVVDASNLILPATTLANYCYQNMFRECTSLTTAPALPATTLATYCYQNMFYGCTSLTAAPVLAATTLASSCYNNMFYGCTSLTTAPALPATTLTSSCYSNMFYGCTGLTTAPALPATTMAANCYNNMFRSCTSLTTAPTLPATTLATNCYQYMFQGCTSLTTAPALPATALQNYCYYYMFSGCTSLTTAPALPATTMGQYCYANMFNGCISLTTAPTLSATTLANYCYNNMFRSCTSLTTAPALPATTLKNYCYQNMFYGCTSLTAAPVLAATTLANYCYDSMFQGCSSLTYIKCLATNISANNCLRNWTKNVASSGTFVKAASMTSWPTGVNGIPSRWTVQDAA